MKYKHALFLNPYFEKSATSAMRIFPPTGLEYVATSAKECVDKVTLLDIRYEDKLSNPVNLIDFITKEIDVVCVSICWDRQIKEICDFLNSIPDNIPIIIGGYTATEKVEEFFSNCPRLNIVVRGEGEETIKDILNCKPWQEILGISYRKDDEIIHNANRPLPEVDNIPAPDRLLRRSKYRLSLNNVSIANLSFDAVLSSRGCPYNCKFCTFNLNPLGQKREYSARNPASVVDEIANLEANIILLSDENFAVDPRRSEAICDLIIARKIKKRFAAQVRLDIAKYPTLLEKMVKAGFKALLIGIESPHDWILKQLNKGFDSKTVRESFKVLKKYSIFYHGYFIYGNIGETEKEMLCIPEFAKEIGVDSITCLKLRIEKFSPLRELALKTPGYHVTDRGELYSDMYSHATLKKIGRRIKFSFYNPLRFFKMFGKMLRIKFFTLKEIGLVFLALPVVLKNFIIRDIEKGRLMDSLKRSFIKNSR